MTSSAVGGDAGFRRDERKKGECFATPLPKAPGAARSLITSRSHAQGGANVEAVFRAKN
jgi:hypothetical protein